MLLTASALLPQLPGQLQDEPAAADRWLTATVEAFGAAATVLRSLGLFDVLHSPLLRILARSGHLPAADPDGQRLLPSHYAFRQSAGCVG